MILSASWFLDFALACFLLRSSCATAGVATRVVSTVAAHSAGITAHSAVISAVVTGGTRGAVALVAAVSTVVTPVANQAHIDAFVRVHKRMIASAAFQIQVHPVRFR